MCKLKSAIILKNRIFMPDYDSHSQMFQELGIEDSYLNASKTFVRVELSPVNGDPFSDIDKWAMNVDQDIKPDWFDVKDYKARLREAVKEWAKTHIYIGVDNLTISSGENYYIKDCHNVAVCGSAIIQDVCGSTIIQDVYGSTMIKNVCDSAMIQDVYDNATIQDVYGFAIIQDVYGSATVISSNIFDWKNSGSVILYDNATFKDCKTKTIYQAGDWKLVSVTEEK